MLVLLLAIVDKRLISVLFLLHLIVVDTWAALSRGYFWLLVVLLLIVTVVESNLLKVLLWTTGAWLNWHWLATRAHLGLHNHLTCE